MPNLDKKNLKTLIIILSTFTICTSIYFLKQNTIEEILFIFSSIIGLVLIRNSFQEDKQRKTIYSLMTKSNYLTNSLKE